MRCCHSPTHFKRSGQSVAILWLICQEKVATLLAAVLIAGLVTGCDKLEYTEGVDIMPELSVTEAYEKYARPFLNIDIDYSGSCFKSFVTAKGDKLYGDDGELRFVSLNAAGLIYTTDDTFWVESTENRRRTTAFEVIDAIKTVAMMNAFAVQDMDVPKLDKLDPPSLPPLPVKDGIVWRGSVGAEVMTYIGQKPIPDHGSVL